MFTFCTKVSLPLARARAGQVQKHLTDSNPSHGDDHDQGWPKDYHEPR
jgi:hypothetical protein